MAKEQTGKRVRMSGEERHELILRRARQVFASHSYPEASTGELARASEITEPMLYKHFGSKKGLFLAVLERFGKQFAREWSERVERRAEKDLLDALAEVIPDYCRTIKADPEIQRVLFQAIAESGDLEIARRVREHNLGVYTVVYQLIERAQREGLLAADLDLDAAVLGYISIIFAMQYNLMLNAGDKLNDRVLAEVSQLWLRAIRQPKD